MKVLSLFSGVGGMDLGLERAGMEIVAQCESEPWRREQLARQFGGHCYEEVREVAASGGERCEPGELGSVGSSPDARSGGARTEDGDVDLLCGGFPCQDVSVAGKRKGLAGERTGLFWEFIRVARLIRPPWILLENVPGLLSSHRGGDFATVLGALVELRYGVAWRILDSRYFGVPQRRRRVFILGALAGDDPRAASRRCAEILSVGTRCTGHTEKGATAGEDVAAPSLSGLGSGGPEDNDGQAGRLVTHSLTSEGHDASEDGTGRGTPLVSMCLNAKRGNRDDGESETFIPVAAPLSHGSHPNSNAAGRRREDDVNLVAFYSTENHPSGDNVNVTPTLKVGTSVGAPSTVAFAGPQGVRRLTPLECERLQAFPENWTQGPDSKRYAAMGDAVTVNVAQWIGERIMKCESQ